MYILNGLWQLKAQFAGLVAYGMIAFVPAGVILLSRQNLRERLMKALIWIILISAFFSFVGHHLPD